MTEARTAIEARIAPRVNDRQEGGDHYKKMKIEPWDAIVTWGLGYLDGNAVKYIARWRSKGGVEDLKKAKHYIEKLLEVEAARAEKTA